MALALRRRIFADIDSAFLDVPRIHALSLHQTPAQSILPKFCVHNTSRQGRSVIVPI